MRHIFDGRDALQMQDFDVLSVRCNQDREPRVFSDVIMLRPIFKGVPLRRSRVSVAKPFRSPDISVQFSGVEMMDSHQY